MNEFKILPLNSYDKNEFMEFTDTYIGFGYYKSSEADKYLKWGNGYSFKALASDSNKLAAIRLTFPPDIWLSHLKPEFLSPSKWRTPSDKVAYFKSLFVADEFQKKGLGSKLTQKSISLLKANGSKAILTHSWKESPGNSSFHYLQRNGFELVNEHPHFWKETDYVCTRCGAPPCKCTGLEMILYI